MSTTQTIADIYRTGRELRLAGTFGEAVAAWQLPSLLPEHGQLFLGNSLIVRLVDAFAQLPCGYPVFANRGASGIDGLLSTAAGVQRATCKPTLVLLGDISAHYDLNALALKRQCSAPTVIIVVALRLLSVGFNVTLPGAVERHRVYLPSESRYLKRPVIHPHADTVDPGDTTKDEEDKPQDGSRPPQG